LTTDTGIGTSPGRLLRPGVPWIPSLQLVFNGRVGVFPEAFQVRRLLDGPVVGRKNIKNTPYPVAADCERALHADEIAYTG